jgi:hypothetical protein
MKNFEPTYFDISAKARADWIVNLRTFLLKEIDDSGGESDELIYARIESKSYNSSNMFINVSLSIS